MQKPREGDLYKTVEIGGKKINLYYGYYEEKERFSKYSDPIPLYPNFKSDPQYTSDGYPLATAMQDACKGYKGSVENDCCFSCEHFENIEELIGICKKEKSNEKI